MTALFVNTNILHGQSTAPSKSSKGSLSQILKGCSDYCERLAQSALYFVCNEKIEETFYDYTYYTPSFRRTKYRVLSDTPQKIEKNNYIYDYQLIKKGNKIEESRILLEENGEQKYKENAPLKTRRFYSKRSVFGPVGLLSEDSQKLYKYEILKEDTIEGRKVIVIEAKPQTNIIGRPNYGKIWIDKQNSSILRIETEEESLVGYDRLKEEAEKHGISPVLKATHYYGYEKKGLRFPSKTIFEESYSGLKLKGKRKKSTTVITYDHYRFFTVEVGIK